MEELHSETQKAEPDPLSAPKIIGLTGGIGSGKTTDIVNDNDDLKQKIKELLGDNAYDENGVYNRKYVAEKVFNDKDLLQGLNEIIHPAVRTDFEDWVKRQTKYLVFKETALLFELKLNLQCYKSILVTAEDNIRIKRVMDRDGKTYREVQAVMEKQMPEKEKIKLADCIIYNNTNLEDLKEQTEKVVFDIE
jgi:dephospho-CoA kinase